MSTELHVFYLYRNLDDLALNLIPKKRCLLENETIVGEMNCKMIQETKLVKY